MGSTCDRALLHPSREALIDMADSSADRALRVAVIGAGPAAVQMHFPVLAQLRDRGEISLAVVCDLQQDRAALASSRFGFEALAGDGIGAIRRADVDAVYLFGSAQLHYEYGLESLKGGKHLFVEKPVAPSHVQAMEMVREATARGCIAACGHNRRFYRSLTEVRERAGRIRWRYAEATFHKAELGKAPAFGAKTWLTANAIHALDALVFVMGGLPEQLTSKAGGAGRSPALFTALMRWPDGAQGVFLCNHEAGVRREEYAFHGPGISLTVTANGLTIDTPGVSEKIQMPCLGDGVLAEHEAFLRAIRSGEAPAHAIEAIAPSLYLAELIEAGYSGAVQEVLEPPELPESRAHALRPRGKSILVVNPERLQCALTQLLPEYRVVTIEDLMSTPGARPDIAAAILGAGSQPLSSGALERMPALTAVGVVGLSLSRYGADELLARGITLVNAAGAYADSVAEFALGLAILARRRAFLSHEKMRNGGWGTSPRGPGIAAALRRVAERVRPLARALGIETPLLRVWKGMIPADPGRIARTTASHDLRGATAGLIGWSANAKAFAERLIHAGARVLVYSEHSSPQEIRACGAAPASLAEALAADIVSLHRGLTRRTRHFMGAIELERLRPGAVLINVARGALMEPGALLARLARGDVFACLDTYEDEPLRPSHPLRALPNVFLTSHIAGGSPEMHAAAAEEVVRKIAALLRGEEVEQISAGRLRNMT
jgi:phosphoglycerate dehydrogenase-like enzyme/predicted dehydrogenase